MSGYTKLFGRILDSTIWREDDKTRILWITMLAMADQDGIVHCTIPGLADRARISLEECETALERFQQPDKYSWSREEEGRRIRIVEGGWFLINHAKYRALMSHEEQKEKTRLRVQKWRAHKSLQAVTAVTCDDGNDKHIAEADTEAKEETFSLDASTSYVLVETGLAGRKIRDVVFEVISRESKKVGVEPKDAADAIIAAWRKYDSMEIPFKLGPEKFLGSGAWRKDSSLWVGRKKETVAERNKRAFEEMERTSE